MVDDMNALIVAADTAAGVSYTPDSAWPNDGSHYQLNVADFSADWPNFETGNYLIETDQDRCYLQTADINGRPSFRSNIEPQSGYYYLVRWDGDSWEVESYINNIYIVTIATSNDDTGTPATATFNNSFNFTTP
jgi:hypothetical protein